MSKYPHSRVVKQVKFTDFMITLIEAPDLTVDYPYTIYSESTNDHYGRGCVTLSFSTQVESNRIMDEHLLLYAASRGPDFSNAFKQTGV